MLCCGAIQIRRNRNPSILSPLGGKVNSLYWYFIEVQETSILVFSIEKDFISLRNQDDLRYLRNLKALHQSLDIELKYLNLVLKYENNLSQITARSRPKLPSKRARKAIKNTLSATNE